MRRAQRRSQEGHLALPGLPGRSLIGVWVLSGLATILLAGWVSGVGDRWADGKQVGGLVLVLLVSGTGLSVWGTLRLRRSMNTLLAQARELRVLEEAGRAAASTLDLGDMGRQIGQVLLDAFESIEGMVMTVVASDAGPHRELVRARDRSRKSLLAALVGRSLGLSSEGASAPEALETTAASIPATSLRVLSTPLVSPSQGTVLGFLSLVVRDSDRVVAHVEPLLVPLGRHVSLAVENWRLYTLATEDGLTGLFVRRYLEARLREEFDRCARSGKHFCLMMLDVDNLKVVNDHHGHEAGDRLLRGVGDALRSSLRAMDVPGRIGGDEFLVLLPDTDAKEGQEAAQRILAQVTSRSFEVDGARVEPGVSIGLVASDSCPPARSVEELQSRVDTALYAAKRGAEKIVTWTSPSETDPQGPGINSGQ